MADYSDIQAIANQLTDDIETNNGLRKGIKVFDTPQTVSNPRSRPRRHNSFDLEAEVELASSSTMPIKARNGLRAKSVTLLENGYGTTNRPKPTHRTPPPKPVSEANSKPANFGMATRKLEI